MRMNKYKYEMIKKDILRISIIFLCIIFIVIMCIIISINYQSENLYLEGQVKSTPLITNEMSRKLGDLYIKLNREFERQIKAMETGYANRKNKRGEIIYYGVNGKENIDEMINTDYVNGIESINYLKTDMDRKDGDSNYTDMITVLNTTLSQEMDKYEDKDIEELFTKLFWLSHTFSGESTELYPCEHGCSWCKYYCGDIRVQGTYGGEIVGFYNCDKYLGKNNEYGLMYNPFINRKRYNYKKLIDMAGNSPPYQTYNMTTYKYYDIEVKERRNGKGEIHTRIQKADKVESEDDEIFLLTSPEGFCEVCSEGRESFTSTTREIGGCINHIECFHGRPQEILLDPDDEEATWFDAYIGYEEDKKTEGCSKPVARNVRCTCEDESQRKNCMAYRPVLRDTGFYECDGHTHFACPGHIIVTCFGHTNLKLNIKIMYYEEMLDEFKKLIS